MADPDPPKPPTPTPASSEGAKDLRSRFATPIEATDPVNSDAQSDEPFADLPTAERSARAGERKPG